MNNWSMSAILQTSGVLAAHADWSVDPRKRWITLAHCRQGQCHLAPPVPVAAPETLIARLRAAANGAPVALGVDFPLGLPRQYAARAGITSFPDWLRRLHPDLPLFDPCRTIEEAGLDRPFYPKTSIAGPGQMARLAAALGLAGTGGLHRAVDRRTANRPAGAALFWTMGANQCGKAALAAWRDCLIPAFSQNQPIAIWPYEGSFDSLLTPGTIALAETYPAEALVQLGLQRPRSKRRQADRAALAAPIMSVITALDVTPDAPLAAQIADGFGPTADGEDRFDSLLGILSIIRIIRGAPDGTPDDPIIRAVEGWVLGQVDPPLARPPASDRPKPHRRPHPAPRSRRAGPPPADSG